MTLTESQVRAIVREELRRQGYQPERLVRVRHCGRGNDPPRCMGSAARGWEYCVCPGVRVEYYR